MTIIFLLEVFELPDYDATESDLLPIFSNVTCPTDHNAYQHCIAVDFLDGFPNDVLLMNENPHVPIILNGHLQNEPNIQVVFILPDEDNPNNYTVIVFYIISHIPLKKYGPT